MFKMGMKNVVAVAFVLAVAAISSAAQDPNQPGSQTAPPDAKAILKQVGETYRNLRNYHFEGRFTQEQVTESTGLKDESKREELFVNAAIKPDRSRIESKNTHFSVTSVSDGKTKCVYAPGANEYTKTEEGPAKPASGRLPTEAESHLARVRNIVAAYSHIDHRVREAKFIGEEKLEFGGRQVDCLVIEADYASASAAGQFTAWTRKLWVDKSRNIIMREIQQTRAKEPWGKAINTKTTYVFTIANVGGQIPETLFAFVPPEGAKEVAELRSSSRPAITPRPAAPRPANLVGKDAIAFALQDLDGNQVELQSLKGKAVLLDFWASWCGPCVAELPHIERLHKDFKDRGLVVLGVNNEEVDVAREFVKRKGYTFTTLADEGRGVTMKYGVSGIPQVFIIDREGKVKWHALGYGPGREVELRSAVEKILKGVDPTAPVSLRAGVTLSPEVMVPKVNPPAPDDGEHVAPSITPSPKIIRLSTDELNGYATNRVTPHYPIEAKKAGAKGTVQVEITVSESGKVIEAKAVSGHELLRDAAVQAAKQWEFNTTEASSAPVKMQGILTFSFALQ